eukprot:6174420-Pleurochrysis_carterae.AAC.1
MHNVSAFKIPAAQLLWAEGLLLLSHHVVPGLIRAEDHQLHHVSAFTPAWMLRNVVCTRPESSQ